MKNTLQKRLTTVAILLAVVAIAGYGWVKLQNNGTPEGFVSGNGRIEATEIDLATQLGGRMSELLVDEGDFVDAGQLLARMQVHTLTAQLDEARAHPAAIINGRPIYDESVPKGRLIGRYATHVWVWINTLSLEIADAMVIGVRNASLVKRVLAPNGSINSDWLTAR